MMVRATAEELNRVQEAIDGLNFVREEKSGDQGFGTAAASVAWVGTYVCEGLPSLRLKLDANSTYLASSEEDGIRRSESGIWKQRGQELVLERQAGDLQYAIRRLRPDEWHPTHRSGWTQCPTHLERLTIFRSSLPTRRH